MTGVPANFQLRLATQRTQGKCLRLAIIEAKGHFPAAIRATAKEILQRLNQVDLHRPAPPSLRVVQWHLTQIDRSSVLRK